MRTPKEINKSYEYNHIGFEKNIKTDEILFKSTICIIISI